MKKRPASLSLPSSVRAAGACVNPGAWCGPTVDPRTAHVLGSVFWHGRGMARWDDHPEDQSPSPTPHRWVISLRRAMGARRAPSRGRACAVLTWLDEIIRRTNP